MNQPLHLFIARDSNAFSMRSHVGYLSPVLPRLPPLARWLATSVALAGVLGGCSPLLYVGHRVFSSEGGEIELGESVSSSTAGSADDYQPTCGSDAGDNAWEFIAPSSGHFRARVDAEYDSVLAIYQGQQELQCNDDHGSTRSSQLEIDLVQGSRYTLVVDGYSSATGSYDLSIHREGPAAAQPAPPPAPPGAPPTPPAPQASARCENAPELDVGIVEGRIEAEGSFSVSCGSAGPGGDIVYRLEVPSSSVLHLIQRSEFDAIIELRAACTDQVVACADDAPDTRRTEIFTPVEPGTYYVIVDTYRAGATGPFLLETRIEPTDEPPAQRTSE
ncbi:MAG: hypothetical protein AAGF12_05610 [Myxococcota bacterium]